MVPVATEKIKQDLVKKKKKKTEKQNKKLKSALSPVGLRRY